MRFVRLHKGVYLNIKIWLFSLLFFLACGCQVDMSQVPQKVSDLSWLTQTPNAFYMLQYRPQRNLKNICSQPTTKQSLIIEVEQPSVQYEIAKIHNNIALNEYRQKILALPHAQWQEDPSVMIARNLVDTLNFCFKTTVHDKHQSQYRLLSHVHQLSIYQELDDKNSKAIVEMEFWLIMLDDITKTPLQWRVAAEEGIKAPYEYDDMINALNKALSRVLEANVYELIVAMQKVGQ